MDSISMCPNILYMSNMDEESSLRWLSASTMTWSHHFDSTSNPEPQNLSQVGWAKLCKAATVCQWTAYQCVKCFLYVYYGCGKQFEVAVSLNHDIMTSFWLHKCPRTQNKRQVGWVKLCKADTVCPWTEYQCAQTLCIHLIWMWEAVWGGGQPQP